MPCGSYQRRSALKDVANNVAPLYSMSKEHSVREAANIFGE